MRPISVGMDIKVNEISDLSLKKPSQLENARP